jgi:copper(I)-binding protein
MDNSVGFALPARSPILAAAAVLAVGLLAGCGTGSTGTTTASPTGAGGTTATAATGPTLKDGWVKAAPNGMTAIFGTLDNPTAAAVTVLSGSSPVASMIELHEVVTVNGTSKMQPKAGGFSIPAHGTHELRPGGDHIMVMGLKQAIKAGDTVSVTLTLSGGGTVAVTALGKDFAAGNESYAPTGVSSMPGMTTMGDMPGMTGTHTMTTKAGASS